jgi:hypothetical protein
MAEMPRQVWDRSTQQELMRTGRRLQEKLQELSREINKRHSKANVAIVIASSVATLGSGTANFIIIFFNFILSCEEKRKRKHYNSGRY